MNNKPVKLASVILSVIVMAGCGTRLSETTAFPETNNNMFQASAITAEFAQDIESEEIMIDEEYYKQFPDPVLGNNVINQIQSGVIPEYQPEPVSPSKEVQSQSFLSIFN